MLPPLKRLIEASISFVLGGTLLYAVVSRFGPRLTMAAMQNANARLLALGIVLMVSGYLLRAGRWPIWERSLVFSNSLRLILIGFMGNNLLPARLGDVLRAHCTAAKTCEERGRTTALASIAVERILDGSMLAMLAIVGIMLVPMGRRLQEALFFTSLVFVALAMAFIFSVRSHERLRSLIAAVSRRFPGHVSVYTLKKANHFIDGFLPFRTRERVARAVLVTVLIWTLETASYYCFGLAVWNGMTLRIALIFVVSVNFVSLIPLTMGGIGSIEVAAPLILVGSGVPSYAAALAIVLWQHGAQYVFTTSAGAIVYLTGRFYRIPFAHPKSLPDRTLSISPASSPVLDDARSTLDALSRSLKATPRSRNEVELSVIVPAYNEQVRLPRTVLETVAWCTRSKLAFELIICDDGSKDQTLALARLFEEGDVRIRALACPHMGKGAAVRFGMLNARGRYVLFMDADGATPVDEIPKLIGALGCGHDVAIGSRITQNPGEVQVKTSLHRRLIGRCFALFVNLFVIGGIGDTQCGFKMFRRESALAIFPRQKMVGFAFDVEILFIARRLSLSIMEVPVNWVAQPGSKVNLVTDSIQMLWEICCIRWLHRNFDGNICLAQRRLSN